MKLRSISIILLFVAATQAFALGLPTTSIVKKQLPLDGVPNVELKTQTNSEYLPDRIVVKLMSDASASPSKMAFGISSIDAVLSHIALSSVERMFSAAKSPAKQDDVDLTKLYVVKFTSPEDPFALAQQIAALPEVQYAEPWFIYKTNFIPNDPSYSLQWGLPKVNAPAAWDVEQGNDTVKIGIVDSGVQWTHPDLNANIWNNPNEIPGNNIDDDNNGYVDDIHGWDFAGADWQNIQGDNNPTPMGSNNEHGTHVAGIAAGTTNNSIGIASIGFKCKILPVKCSADNDTRAPGGYGYILTGYQGIVYASMMGADVVNCSWGGTGGSQSEQDIINAATQMGTLVVAAAGNDGTNGFQSPAGYRNVLGVAATNSSDVKASFSNYGEIVDVSAPGTSIYSTIYNNSYTYLDGTSMASPFTAGLCGLVKSHFPDYTALQVGEQVRMTCTNIDAINPGYVGQLGRGRINASAAMTASTLPSLRLQKYVVSDSFGGNGNGFPQPSETLSVVTNYQNFLASTTNATVTLTTTSTYITILNGSYPMGVVPTLGTASNASAPFRLFVKANVPASHKVTVKLTVTDGSYSDVQNFTFLVNPTFQTTDVSAFQLTLTNNGKLGFFDFPTNSLGSGCIFNGVNHLFEGGLIIGTSATKTVSVVRNPNNAQDADFTSTNFYALTTPGVISDQDGYTFFTDNSAPSANKIGVRVDMYSYAFGSAPNNKFIIMRYDIKNTTAAAISSVHVGQFYDWDLGSASSNYAKYDATRSLGYCYDSGTNARKEYIGIRALDSAKSYRTLINAAGIGLTRADKWAWISGGTATNTGGPADVHNVIASGPYTIQPNESITIGFAIAAGDSSLAQLQENADAAKTKWMQIRSMLSVNDERTTPAQFALLENYPNPFNPTTTIVYSLPVAETISLKVFDVLGKEIATLINNEHRNAGTYSLEFDASNLPSGIYFTRLQTEQSIAVKKMLLMK